MFIQVNISSPSVLSAALAMLCMSMTPLLSHASQEGPRLFGKDHAFEIHDLPVGALRSNLEGLSAVSRSKAMATLSTFTFGIEQVASLRVDVEGGVAFACAAPAKPVGEASVSMVLAAPTQGTRASVPIANVPVYHSRTGSAKVIYLDFNGHVISGTAYNDTFNAGQPYDTQPFSIDADLTTFSDLEQDWIRRVWMRVSEDYAPFDVDVTTEEPAVLTPTTGRALITQDVDKNGANMPAVGAGGFAYFGVFGTATYVSRSSPALVYYDNHFGQWDLLADTASHEIGHNFNLQHDGGPGEERYTEHGSGNIEWSPLMGNSSRVALSQWSKGEYFGATQFQDDLAVLAANLGYRPDDHADTTAGATPIVVDVAGQLDASSAGNLGVIEQHTDSDVFCFNCGVGTVAIHVDPMLTDDPFGSANLDVEALLFDASGNLLASNNPPTGTSADLTHSVSGGTFYVAIGNSGAGSPLTDPPSGYTEYASLGQFFLTGTVPPTVARVVSPVGQDMLMAGDAHAILWNQGSNVASNMKIDLLHNGNPYRTLAASVQNTGSFIWTVGADLAESGLYAVRLTQLTDGISDTSDTFAVFTNCHESFESGFGQWQNAGGDDTDWDRDSNGTPSSGTGPSSGSRGSTFYLYVEGSGHLNETALLELSGLDFSGAVDVHFGFDYHMYGLAMGSLSLDVFDGAWHTNLWSVSGPQHSANADPWSRAGVKLTSFVGSSNVTLRFRGDTGNGFSSDMAIDCTRLVISVPPTGPDQDNDGLPDAWENRFPQGMAIEPDAHNDADTLSNIQEFIAGTDPTNSASTFRLDFSTSNALPHLRFYAIEADGAGYEGLSRFYALEFSQALSTTQQWSGLPGLTNLAGADQWVAYTNLLMGLERHYRARTWLEAAP